MKASLSPINLTPPPLQLRPYLAAPMRRKRHARALWLPLLGLVVIAVLWWL